MAKAGIAGAGRPADRDRPVGPAGASRLVRHLPGRRAGVLALAAAIALERRVVQVAMLGYLAWSVPHALWHLTAIDEALGTTDDVINIGALAVTVAVPLVLLLTANRLGRSPAQGVRP